MRIAGFKSRMTAGEMLSGTFVKTPDIRVIEVLAQSGLDFLCLDAEHSPFGRNEMDACLAMACALDMPMFIRVPSGAPEAILAALDCGAVGVVVPHVDSVAKAEAVARAARFGPGGRGFAGSTRWAGYATRPMGEVLAKDVQTIVIAQIEEPAGVDAVAEIAAVPGIDALFAGPGDLSVSYGETVVGSEALTRALAAIGAAARQHGKTYVTWVSDAATAAEWAPHGMTMFVVASEHSWIRSGAAEVARGIRSIAP
ncbi:HpcH/HpaI aldolase family protein [Flavimaricola marinus]|uniref:5-keto-4-deoxy-D-glucarate aldolase n=1 Tax=Flavimaricola marinus TaxID=1819565 RepID=A0A238LGM3_9RHOB|nr:aldolase/citrate lyase family protein [Flavimaricola marinus]SMY08693.1 5-keto-4-deoxy-D-glucarate aldolase [Flavimaricola marinus]